MHAEPSHPGAPTLLRALFWLITILILASMAFAGWFVAEYWGRVGV